jgi:hypothetical protein
MSIKSKLLAGAAALTLVSGLGASSLAMAGAANAATPSCGPNCIDIFSHQFGTFHHPNFVMDVFKQAQNVGQPIILFRTSNTDPAEDFTVANQGTVNDFFQAGLVSAAVNLHYGGGACFAPEADGDTSATDPACDNAAPNDQAYEFEYAPYGADSGLCVGTASTAVSGTKVSLQACGVSSKTVWIVDSLDSPMTNDVPLINGSDTNFSHPFVLTYPGSGYPTDKPRPQLYTANITGSSNGGGPILGTVNSNQLWAADAGVLP